ncbi:von Willebrand factor type A domain protein [Methyloligella halotolerans]|uniref:von Willebrand factor type A domain protein n=1 Tax=Methyloligella halotolerans TaxID=1177755 RepID=A0A1E2RVZ1_9HYPH|nr:pilus assembly protein [Methyloligella halotolerans]ODA66383.1 von Willebrand factor type A domain protein [Methyloligella halotolerans]
MIGENWVPYMNTNALLRLVRDFVKARGGNVAILFGVALIPILLAVGIAVDYGRALSVRDRMSEATDAAALAIGSWPDLTQPQMEAKAQEFFDANYPKETLGTAGKVKVRFDNDNNIFVSVSGEVPTTFMKLANFKKMDVGAETMVTKEERNIELVLVLDTTGSMGSGGKMDALKSAAREMVNTLFDGKSTSDTLKIGVVPFSAAVNVGANMSNSPWLDRSGQSSIAIEDFNPGDNTWTLYSQLRNRSWGGCVRERATPYELTDTTPTNSNKETLFAPYFAPDEPDSGGYVNNYLADQVPETCRVVWFWKVCEPETTDPAKIQRMTNKYQNASVGGNAPGPNYLCPPNPVTAMTNNKNTVLNAINALNPDGSTVIPAGLLWGWRAISDNAPFTEGAPYDDETWVKAIVLLTDGENSVNGGSNRNGHNHSNYNAFGYAAEGHLGNTSGSNADSTLDQKTLTVCSNIKDKKIRLYTIGFQVSGNVQTLLRNCATEPDMAYNSPSNSQLAGIFQDIAQGLGELRIAR